MIVQLSDKYRKPVAYMLFIIFYLELVIPLRTAAAVMNEGISYTSEKRHKGTNIFSSAYMTENKVPVSVFVAGHSAPHGISKKAKEKRIVNKGEKILIGGPSSPEAASFKQTGSDNLVNLFTGDFSYSIPLLDVGGYPVNLFYSGGITMDQEASWVGLGWNINPGTVSRNMRGVPDDFDGTDLLTQKQNTKPNRTWGGELGVDGEFVGWKKPNINLSLGISYNNYLGPELELGAKTSITLATFDKIKFEKSATDSFSASLNLGLGAKLSSRSGLTLLPSLNANVSLLGKNIQSGVGLNTSYNSRSGISNLTLHSEMSFYSNYDKEKYDGTNAEKYKNQHTQISANIGSSTFSFAKPSYMPTLRMPMQNSYYSGQLEFGGGLFGVRGAGTGTGYYSESSVPVEWQTVQKPLVGFIYSENATDNPDAVMDFNRLNDGEVTPNTPIISAPQYSYDIFSIQGEGTGGSIRAYRGDMGFMKDNVTVSKDKNFSIGLDIAPPGHYGGNWNIVSTPTRAGGWHDANNTLMQTMQFKHPQNNSSFENVYFKNPGESSVTNEEQLNRIGGDDLVRFKLGGTNVNARLETQLERFDKKTGTEKGTVSPVYVGKSLQHREKRTQVTTMLTAEDAANIGLEKTIRNYTGSFNGSNLIQFAEIPRVGGYRKGHHISEITVLEQSGMRYVYGIPVYNTIQRDFTFSVKANADATTNLVNYESDEPTINSQHTQSKAKMDGYVQSQETPAYASSFLLTGLLSPDYVDVTNDGITEDDIGNAVKFDYTKSADLHKWRTPRNNSVAMKAFFNEGVRTEKRDNKASISYGEREVWYLGSIESKSMIAIFKTESRNDAKGVYSDMDGRVNSAENANKKLSRIDLYTKSEIKQKGINNAKPIKSVNFEYDYSLCAGTPDNPSGGKLTLKSVYFTYNGQNRLKKDKYIFNYGFNNPSYTYAAADRWGNYKKASDNPVSLRNVDYPYTLNSKTLSDSFAAAWSLKKILLPSGGQIQVDYEADDYAYVQDRRACNMFSIYGFGTDSSFASSSALYKSSNSAEDNYYVYVDVVTPITSTGYSNIKKEVYSKYLESLKQLAFKLQMNMPDGVEPLTMYADYEDYGLCPGSDHIIYLKLKKVDDKSPLAKSAIGFLTNNIPAQAFPGYRVEVDGIAAFLDMCTSMLSNIKAAFKNVDTRMRDDGNAKTVVLSKSFIRLANGDRIKHGGGQRVKRVTMQDNWDAMTGQYNSRYGQEYDYTTTEKINGKEVVISSGVASYEPGIGSEENPFREIVNFSNKLPLAPAQYGAIEMPMLEGLYPSPCVGYSKVTVRSIHRKGTHGDSTLRSAIGKQVTEFYTAKDYPTYSTYTGMSVKEYSKNPFMSFVYKEIINRRTISQGFLVETNDMHGRMKSQTAYSESDEKTPLSYSYHTYKNTGKQGLNDKVDFVYNEGGGTVAKGNMGVDIELMTDVREFKITSNGFNGQAQVDIFPFGLFIYTVFSLWPLKTYQENQYRAVTCTKLINYHAIEDSVIVMDKGSVISTQDIVYDAETGAPVVSKTANEFNDSIYNVTYPAYWAYSSVAPAYKNIGIQYTGVNFYDGKITSNIDTTIFESGDEIYITSPGSGSSGCIAPSASALKLWAFDTHKNTTDLTVPSKNIIFLDEQGKPFTRNNVSFRIIRSGRRNNLGLNVATVSAMKNPVQDVSSYRKLVINEQSKVVSATAVELKEKWQTDNDLIKQYFSYYDTSLCATVVNEVCEGYLEKEINPYCKGLIGTLKPYQSLVFYGNRQEKDFSNVTNIRENGYIDSFKLYWDFNAYNNLVPDQSNTKWVWNSRIQKINAKGQELETKDALDRYTAAQYGFNKGLPVAVVQNARYGESFAEGFEDHNYNERINAGSQDTCTEKKYIYLGSAGNIVSADSLGFAAHSGKQILKIQPSSTQTVPLEIATVNADSFELVNAVTNVVGLSNPGGNITYKTVTPVFLPSSYTDQTGTIGIDFSNYSYMGVGFGNLIASSNYLYDSLLPGMPPYSYRNYSAYRLNGQQYVNITTCQYYKFQLSVQHWAANMTGGVNRARLEIKIYSLNHTLMNDHIIACGDMTIVGDAADYYVSTLTDSVFLTPGIYSLESDIDFYHLHEDMPSDHGFYSHFSCVANIPGPSYKTLDSSTFCHFRRSIEGAASMINPTFALQRDKKMQFSAWIKEDCTDPCTKTDYTNSDIQIWSGATNVGQGKIKRTGAIIDGWQKIEGDFILPAGASSAQIKFVNSNSAPMYVDDIRIHPFNANMKSYVYDPRTLRLSAELDENNYATFYEYDEEGQLVRVKKETIQGIKTINETRSAKQRIVTDVQ